MAEVIRETNTVSNNQRPITGEGSDAIVSRLLAIPNLSGSMRIGILKAQSFWNQLKSSIQNATTWNDVFNAEQTYLQNTKQLAVYTDNPRLFNLEINKELGVLSITRRIGNSRSLITQTDKDNILTYLNARSNGKQASCITGAIGTSLVAGATLPWFVGVGVIIGAVVGAYYCYHEFADKEPQTRMIAKTYLQTQNISASQMNAALRESITTEPATMNPILKWTLIIFGVGAIIWLVSSIK